MIEQKDIEHLLELSRLEISSAEKKELQKDLEAILKYVDVLSNVDVKNIEAMTGGTFNQNEYRQEDFDLEGFDNKDLLKSAPAEKDGYFEVNNIF